MSELTIYCADVWHENLHLSMQWSHWIKEEEKKRKEEKRHKTDAFASYNRLRVCVLGKLQPKRYYMKIHNGQLRERAKGWGLGT